MEKADKGWRVIRIGVSGWMFILVPAHMGSPKQRAIKQLLLLLCPIYIYISVSYNNCTDTTINKQSMPSSGRVILDSNKLSHSFIDSWLKVLLHLPSEQSETGGYTVFTFVCPSVCLDALTPVFNNVAMWRWHHAAIANKYRQAYCHAVDETDTVRYMFIQHSKHVGFGRHSTLWAPSILYSIIYEWRNVEKPSSWLFFVHFQNLHKLCAPEDICSDDICLTSKNRYLITECGIEMQPTFVNCFIKFVFTMSEMCVCMCVRSQKFIMMSLVHSVKYVTVSNNLITHPQPLYWICMKNTSTASANKNNNNNILKHKF